MNQRYRNETRGGYHGDPIDDRDERGARPSTASRDWDQRDLGTRGGEYANYGSYGDRGFGQGAGGREFREYEVGGDAPSGYARGRPYGNQAGSRRHATGPTYGREEPYAWGDDEYLGSPGGDNRFLSERDRREAGYGPVGAVNQRDFGGGQGMGATGGYGGGYGGAEGYREPGRGGQDRMHTSYDMGGQRSRSQGFAGQNYRGQGGYGRTDFGAGQGFGGQDHAPMYGVGHPSGDYGGQGAGQYGGAMGSRGFRGLGPKGYQRSDERLQEDICERLTDDRWIDASDVSVRVAGGVVTLEGSVDDRQLKHRIEDVVEQCGGVTEIRNYIAVSRASGMGGSRSAGSGSSAAAGTGAGSAGASGANAGGAGQRENAGKQASGTNTPGAGRH